MHADGGKPPFIYFHGNFYKFGYSAIALAKLLGSDQPLFAISPHGVGGEAIPPSIEAMAADSLELIINAQPKGPYRLGGKCLGGIRCIRGRSGARCGWQRSRDGNDVGFPNN